MTRFFFKIISILSLAPGIHFALRLPYTRTLKKLKANFKDDPSIMDILLTSNIKSSNFIFGQSDYNFLIIVKNETHPKTVLRNFRAFIKKDLFLNMTVNTRFIPILSESEFKTDILKSYLFRNSYKEVVNWHSILKDSSYNFFVRKQDRYAICYNSFQALDRYLLRGVEVQNKRLKLKNILRSLANLSKYFEDLDIRRELTKKKKLERISLWNIVFPKKLEKSIWTSILNLPAPTTNTRNKQSLQDLPIEPTFKTYLKNLLAIPFIDDITLTPTLIQTTKHQIKGKLFIDIHLNEILISSKQIENLIHLKVGILEHSTSQLKVRIRFTSKKLYEIQNELSFYPFPLEALFRKKKTVSLSGLSQNYIVDHEHLIMASIHFLITQFMRFRSLQQKTDLIGSKFIKSLNLMYKYYLLLDFLKGNEFQLTNEEKLIRENLTPQFSEIDVKDTVTEEHWVLIKSQLIYLLKEIREELLKYDSSLKLLRF